MRHNIRPVGPTICGYFIPRLLADLQGVGVALCGATGRERLGEQVSMPHLQNAPMYSEFLTHSISDTFLRIWHFDSRRAPEQVPNVQAFLHVVLQLVAAWNTDSAAGDKSAFMHIYLAVMEGGALYFQVRKEWIRVFVYVGFLLVLLGCALMSHAPKPAGHLLAIGLPWFVAGSATFVVRRLTARAAKRAVEVDRAIYDEAWRQALDSPENRAGRAEVEALVAGLRAAAGGGTAGTAADASEARAAALAVSKRKGRGGGDGWEWELPGRGARQALPRRRGGRWRLMEQEGYELMSDLETLYDQAPPSAAPLLLRSTSRARSESPAALRPAPSAAARSLLAGQR